MCTNDFNSRVVMRQKPHSFARAMIYEVFYLLETGSLQSFVLSINAGSH